MNFFSRLKIAVHEKPFNTSLCVTMQWCSVSIACPTKSTTNELIHGAMPFLYCFTKIWIFNKCCKISF